MPAGDAGLERQPADSEYQAICGWVTKYGWLNAAMAERVRQLLHRQQAVVDAAREFVDDDPCRYDHNDYCQTHYGQRPCHMERLRAALAAQAVQLEGERAR